MSDQEKPLKVPGTHSSECLCSDCRGARAAREAAESRARREAVLSFSADQSVWARDGWRN